MNSNKGVLDFRSKKTCALEQDYTPIHKKDNFQLENKFQNAQNSNSSNYHIKSNAIHQCVLKSYTRKIQHP